MKKTNKSTITQFKWIFLLFSVVLITTGIISYQFAARELKGQLSQKCHALAATIAVIIAEDSDGYADFLENQDINSNYYHKTKNLMMKLKEVNEEHVTYIYTVSQCDETTAMYVIGGEPPNSPVYTAPGETAQISDAWRTAFQQQTAVLGDRFINTPYGVRLSSYVPIFHSQTGEFMGLVGADITQSQYSTIMMIFVIQTVIGLIAGISVFATSIWKLSGNVTFMINKERYEAEVARRIMFSGRNYYQKLDEIHDKLRILRHDYKYHLNATRKMLGSGETNKAELYLTQVEEKLADYAPQNFCSNRVINALVGDYAERCKKLLIQFDGNLQIPEAFNIPDYELCIILGNLLENAMDACQKLDDSAMILIQTQSIHNQVLFMIKNSFNGEISYRDGLPVSKKNEGGFGIRSVKEVISKYGGDITFEWDSHYFTAFVAVGVLIP